MNKFYKYRIGEKLQKNNLTYIIIKKGIIKGSKTYWIALQKDPQTEERISEKELDLYYMREKELTTL